MKGKHITLLVIVLMVVLPCLAKEIDEDGTSGLPSTEESGGKPLDPKNAEKKQTQKKNLSPDEQEKESDKETEPKKPDEEEKKKWKEEVKEEILKHLEALLEEPKIKKNALLSNYLKEVIKNPEKHGFFDKVRQILAPYKEQLSGMPKEKQMTALKGATQKAFIDMVKSKGGNLATNLGRNNINGAQPPPGPPSAPGPNRSGGGGGQSGGGGGGGQSGGGGSQTPNSMAGMPQQGQDDKKKKEDNQDDNSNMLQQMMAYMQQQQAEAQQRMQELLDKLAEAEAEKNSGSNEEVEDLKNMIAELKDSVREDPKPKENTKITELLEAILEKLNTQGSRGVTSQVAQDTWVLSNGDIIKKEKETGRLLLTKPNGIVEVLSEGDSTGGDSAQGNPIVSV